jgi:uncharacterized repeat protein (TIGR03803 family)
MNRSFNIVLTVIGVLSFLTFNTYGANYTVLRNFGILTNMTGLHPPGRLAQGPDGTLYGTTTSQSPGGTSTGAPGEGFLEDTIFAVRPDGTGFRVLQSFISHDTNSPSIFNLIGGLVLGGATLYGESGVGGTVFAINTDGTGFRVLYSPTNATDAHGPIGGLVLSGGMLYGVSASGGTHNAGTVFALSTTGAGFTKLYNFTGGNDGAEPNTRLVLADGILYGATTGGGPSGYGTMFAVGTDGTGFTNLTSYVAPGQVDGLVLAGSLLIGTVGDYLFAINTNGTGFTNFFNFNYPYPDGGTPAAGLVSVGGTLYGTATQGGSTGNGTVFAINPDGTGLRLLHSFTGVDDGAFPIADLLVSGDTLYGTTLNGGSGGGGTVFSINTSGTGFSNIFAFRFSDAAEPQSGLLLSGHRLYGTSYEGGSGGYGTVFALGTDGTGYTILHDFSALPPIGLDTNSDGAYPEAALVLSGNTLYGTTLLGGSGSFGTVFSVNTDGTGFTNLFEFDLINGGSPYAGLALSGTRLYGTTITGGASGDGRVFAINTDGSDFNSLWDFSALSFNATILASTNVDGSSPYGTLVLSGNTLYGTTFQGGAGGNGTIFAVNRDGSGFTNLYSFSPTTLSLTTFAYTNADGAHPYAGLLLSGGTLYGTAYQGGKAGAGTVFALSTNGTGFTTLYNFSNNLSSFGWPYGGLVSSGTRLYGTAIVGGEYGFGGVFAVGTNGSNFANFYTFPADDTGSLDGGSPYGGLALSGNMLYGTASLGGTLGDGIVFALDLSLNIGVSGSKVVLSWLDPTLALTSSTNVTGPYALVSGAASPYTNTITPSSKFFKLQPK